MDATRVARAGHDGLRRGRTPGHSRPPQPGPGVLVRTCPRASSSPRSPATCRHRRRPADPPPTLPASAASGRGELTSAARKCRRFDAGVAAFAAISSGTRDRTDIGSSLCRPEPETPSLRNEYFIRAHVCAQSGILAYAYRGLVGDCRETFLIVRNSIRPLPNICSALLCGQVGYTRISSSCGIPIGHY